MKLLIVLVVPVAPVNVEHISALIREDGCSRLGVDVEEPDHALNA